MSRKMPETFTEEELHTLINSTKEQFSEKEFEKKFPSVYDKRTFIGSRGLIDEKYVETHLLDKQRVRDAFLGCPCYCEGEGETFVICEKHAVMEQLGLWREGDE